MSDDVVLAPMNAALTLRLRFIDFLLDHYRQLNRSAIIDYFGVSTPQASMDMQQYLLRAPDNAVYDRRARVYRATGQFRRIWP